MNNTKIVDILKNGNLVLPLFLLKKYKELNLELEEFIFLIYLYNQGNSFLFDPNKFREDLNIELSMVMNCIDILTDKGLIKVDVQKNEKGITEEIISLDGFYEKVSLLMMNEVNDSKDTSKSNIYEMIEKEFGRTLSPIEYEIIKAWLDSNIDEVLIKEAIKESTFNGVANLRYIDKILYEWGKSNINTVEDVENLRKRRNTKEKDNPDIDIDIVDWNWFDDEE